MNAGGPNTINLKRHAYVMLGAWRCTRFRLGRSASNWEIVRIGEGFGWFCIAHADFHVLNCKQYSHGD